MKIFVCYRRADTEDAVDRLSAVLNDFVDPQDELGVDIFVDVHTIEPGEIWMDALARRVADCDVMLVMIGKHWLTLADENGRVRLEREDDPVRREIRAAVTGKKKIVPVLIGNASPPPDDHAVEEVSALGKRQAFAIHRQSFEHDCSKLAEWLGLARRSAPPPVPLVSPKRSRSWLAVIVVCLVVASIGVGVWYFNRPHEPVISLVRVIFGPDKANPIRVVSERPEPGDVEAIWGWANKAKDDSRADRGAAAKWLELKTAQVNLLEPSAITISGNELSLPEDLVFCRAFTSPDYNRIDIQDDRGESLRIVAQDSGLRWYSANILHVTMFLAAVPRERRDELVARGICTQPRELLAQNGRRTCVVPNTAYFNWQVSCT